MRSIIKFLIIALILGSFIGVAAFYFSSWQYKEGQSFDINEDLDELEVEQFNESKEVGELKQTAWIPYWDFDRGYESLVKNKNKFESVSPTWYELNPDGSLKVLKKSSHSKLEKFCKDNEILLIPSIATFDAVIMESILNSEENFDRHIDAILNEVDKYDYDGIDIDYESTFIEDKELFMKFLKELSAELKERDKILTIAVLSKWGDDVTYPSSPQTREVQDWEEIAKYVDEIRIMVYDYTSTVSKYPGPIAPLVWVNEVLQYAVTKIPREKIVLGVHLYAYEWVNEEFNPEVDINKNPLQKKTQVNAYEYSDILSIKNTYEYEELPEDSYGEIILLYKKNETNRIIFYINGNGVKARKELAAKYGIKGTAYWRLGGEDDSGF